MDIPSVGPDPPEDFTISARPEDLNVRARFEQHSRASRRRVTRAVLLWAVGMIFLILAAILLGRVGR